MQSVSSIPVPKNEPAFDYAPGTQRRLSLRAELADLAATAIDLTMTIGGVQRLGGGDEIRVVQPHARHELLGTMRGATPPPAPRELRGPRRGPPPAAPSAAIDAAPAAAPAWAAMSYDDRAAILLKA